MAEQLQQLSGDLQATRTEVATLQQAVGTMQGSIDTIAAQLAKPQQAGANVENGPRAASSDTRPQKRPRGPHGHGQLAAARPMVNPEHQFGVPMVAAFGGFGPGQGYGRGFYPRMDGLPPGQRFDGRQRIPPYRICYICGKPGCESWMHRGDTRGMTYRDALVGGQSRFQGGQGQGQNGQNQGANRSDQEFYDRFAHGQGHRRGNKFGGRGRGRGR
jgi:hypothetical protein